MTRALVVACVLAVGAGEARAKEVDVEVLVKAVPKCEAARATCVAIRLHVAVTGEGAVATAEWIAAQFAVANRHFAAIDVGFQVAGIEALPESAARIEDAKERTSLAPRVAGTVIDVFVTGYLGDIDVAGDYIYGVAWPKGTKKYVILSTMARDRTLAHELGHVFGLPHSSYAISIMNKSERTEPPQDKRTFHADELAVMRAQAKRLLRDKVIEHVPPPKPAIAPR